MCGIIGILSTQPVASRLVDGLRRLEYRGYDSSGIATIHDGVLDRRRAEGKLDNLVRVLDADPLPGATGIAHTRWATHGAPTTDNAHPHATEEVALVHNGIIENFKALREEVLAAGRTLTSQTDTEVVAHLLTLELLAGLTPDEAVAKTLKRLHGAFSFAILFRAHPEIMYGARRGSPLVVGTGDGEMFLGSDALGLAPLHKPHRLSRGGRLGEARPRQRAGVRRRRPPGHPADDHLLGLERGHRKGQLPALHGKGDP